MVIFLIYYMRCILIIVSVSRIERDIKRRVFFKKTREFGDPPGDTNRPPKEFSHVDHSAPEFLQPILGNHY